MTVGIAAIAENDGDPNVVMAADRMVTMGDEGGIEYEDTESKIEPFVQTDTASAVVVGAGRTMLIDEVIDNLHSIVAGSQSDVDSARKAMQYVKVAYQQTLRDTIENQAFRPLGYHLEDLRDETTHIPEEIQRTLAEQAQNLRRRYGEGVRFIVGAVGPDGPGIYYVSGSDFTNATEIGYAAIGTGGTSAQLTFIRREYDKNTSFREGVFTVLEAKSHSEERQGVGRQMDIALVRSNRIYPVDDIDNLREKLNEIKFAEQEARRKVMVDWDP
jgi:20S proteasome alpha/beta subunit